MYHFDLRRCQGFWAQTSDCRGCGRRSPLSNNDSPSPEECTLKELYSSSLLQQVVTGEQATRILNSNLQRTVENMQAQLDAFSRQVDLLTDSPSRRGQKSSSPAGVAPGAVMLAVAKVESARSAGIPAPPELKRKSNIAPAHVANKRLAHTSAVDAASQS